MSENEQSPVPPMPEAPKSRRTGLVVGLAVLATLLVLGGVGAAVLLGSSDDDKDDSPEVVSVADFCAGVQTVYDIPKSETDEDPGSVSDAFREVGVPEGMPDAAKQGREDLLELGDDAEDGDEAKAAAEELAKDADSPIVVFYNYVRSTCPDLDPMDTVEVSEWCTDMAAAYKALGEAQSTGKGDPEDFANGLRDAGITAEMSDVVLSGRAKTIQVLRDVDSYEGIKDIDETFSKDEKAATDAYFQYYVDKCGS
jgi:hypothetical protein